MIGHPDLDPQWFTGAKLKENPRLGECIFEAETALDKMARTGAFDMPPYYHPWDCFWGNINEIGVTLLDRHYGEWARSGDSETLWV